ncbi:DOMON domain protein [Ancylostoma caninum]|uniref:DOMON domain protein n=1 Tax=Ancylostoma caninum TaxID=29170 RepID=A0A368H5N6_ANCCA|nr:DOMON domain protein [Ancylostoma caninum]
MHAVNKHILVYSLESLIVLITACLVQAEFDATECGKTKGCVRAPKECTSNEDCKISFSYKVVDGDKMEMEIFGKPPIEEDAYIAVGFSNDTRMGNDLVVFCAREEEKVFAGVAIHGQRTKIEVLKKSMFQDSKGVQEQLSASQQDGTYYCKVSQVQKRSDDDMYSLDKSYHILLATGPYNNGSEFFS